MTLAYQMVALIGTVILRYKGQLAVKDTLPVPIVEVNAFFAVTWDIRYVTNSLVP